MVFIKTRALQAEEYYINDEPYYEAIGDEMSSYESANRQGLPILRSGLTAVAGPALWST